MKCLILIFIVVSILSCITQIELPETNSMVDINEQLERYYDKSLLPGVGILAVKGDSTVFIKNLGYSDRASQRPFTENTVQAIGSISKTILAVATMKAVELELLELDSDINSYLTFPLRNPRHPEKKITLRHLVTHSSSIRDWPDVYLKSYYFENASQVDFSEFPKLVDNREIILLKKNELVDDRVFIEKSLSPCGDWFSHKMFSKYAPGEHFQYSNIGAALVAYVIETVCDGTYEDFVQQYIFDPLEMNNTYWSFDQVPNKNLATKYYYPGITIPNYHLITRADGGIYTSTSDLGKFLIDIRNGLKNDGRLLQPESYKEMLTRYQIGKEYSGIFWGVTESGVVQHNGGDPGLMSFLAHIHKSDMSYIVFTNCSAEIDKNMWLPFRNMISTLVKHNF